MTACTERTRGPARTHRQCSALCRDWGLPVTEGCALSWIRVWGQGMGIRPFLDPAAIGTFLPLPSHPSNGRVYQKGASIRASPKGQNWGRSDQSASGRKTANSVAYSSRRELAASAPLAFSIYRGLSSCCRFRMASSLRLKLNRRGGSDNRHAPLNHALRLPRLMNAPDECGALARRQSQGSSDDVRVCCPWHCTVVLNGT